MVLAMFMNLIYLGPCRPMCVRVKQLCYPVLQEFNIPWPEALGKHQGCQFSLIIPSPFFINNVFHEKLSNYVCLRGAPFSFLSAELGKFMKSWGKIDTLWGIK